MEFTMSATVEAPCDETLARVRELLVDAGFGVLTEIDVAATLKTKLDVEIPPQVILGACRPQLAHRALQADPRIAAMLPCNVVVAEAGSGARVDVFDPAFMASVVDDPELGAVAADARERLGSMLARLTA